jgi:DNA-binding response OmpR family regulator
MSRTVLLADYDPRSIDRIRRFLEPLGVRTVLATDGYAAEREFHRVLPDLTLVQDLLPHKRGFQVCRDLKESAHGSRRPILLLACLRNGSRMALRMSGCDDWIETPFDAPTLVAKVRRFIPDLPVGG